MHVKVTTMLANAATITCHVIFEVLNLQNRMKVEDTMRS